MTQQTAVRLGNMFPCLFYSDATTAIDWLMRAFGFQTLIVVPGEAPGSVLHAELRLGDGVVMVGSAGSERFVPSASPRDLGRVTGAICVYLDDADVDDHYARARAAGAEITHPLEAKEYGGRSYSARDAEGHVWTFGSYMPDPTPAS